MELDNGFYNFPCPHCNLMISVKDSEINCGIFRHAVLKTNMMQINPHSSKDICDKLFTTDKIYGCAKPYEMYKDNNSMAVRICDYK